MQTEVHVNENMSGIEIGKLSIIAQLMCDHTNSQDWTMTPSSCATLHYGKGSQNRLIWMPD